MSQETQAWAKRQITGDPVTRAVLVELCNWAKPTGVVEFLSLQMIADAVEVSRRTVMRHLDKLENSLTMIERLARHRDDGGQSANGFRLVGYAPPVEAVKPRRQSVTPPRQSGTEPRDTAVTRLGDKIKNPLSTNVDASPASNNEDDQGKGDGDGEAPIDTIAKPHRLPDGWTAPPVADLSPVARELVGQWQAGAYEAVGETFRLHWRNETRAIGKKLDWADAFAKWLISDHAKVMRDAKFGVSFARLATAGPAGQAVVPVPVKPVAAKVREDHRSLAIHCAMKLKMGERSYEQWLGGTALIVSSGGGLRIIGSSPFMLNWLQSNFEADLSAIAAHVIGGAFTRLKFEVETPSTGSE